jgi:glutamate dehydrogenase/leucine dehydrogenase
MARIDGSRNAVTTINHSSGARPAGTSLGAVAGVFDIVSPRDLDATGGLEQVVYCHDAASGLKAIIAVHSTALGPALGGTRFYPYPSEHDALVDVCRLARSMTAKHAVCGNDLGGGKAVILGDPAALRSEALLRAYGRFIEGLNGRYVTAEDVGTTQADMDVIRRETAHVTGVSESLGGSGDPSPATAWGVLWAMKAVGERLWGTPSLAGRHVCIAGVGKVGAALADHLADEGAKLTVADVRAPAVDAVVERHGAASVAHEVAHSVPCDIFSPCALGAALSATTIPELRCDAVVGAANNQLAAPADAERLRHRGIVYVPDYVANAGGVINIAHEPHGYERAQAYDRVRTIRDTVLQVFQRAEDDGVTTAAAADRLAEERIASVSRTRLIRTGAPPAPG